MRVPVASSQRCTVLSCAPAKTKRSDGSKRQPRSGLVWRNSRTRRVRLGSTTPDAREKDSLWRGGLSKVDSSTPESLGWQSPEDRPWGSADRHDNDYEPD